MLTFTKRVKSGDTALKQELMEFSATNTIEKPETGTIVVTKVKVAADPAKKKRPLGLSLGGKKFVLTHGLDTKDDTKIENK